MVKLGNLEGERGIVTSNLTIPHRRTECSLFGTIGYFWEGNESGRRGRSWELDSRPSLHSRVWLRIGRGRSSKPGPCCMLTRDKGASCNLTCLHQCTAHPSDVVVHSHHRRLHHHHHHHRLHRMLNLLPSRSEARRQDMAHPFSRYNILQVLLLLDFVFPLIIFPTGSPLLAASSLSLASAAGISLSNSSPPFFIFGASMVDAGQNAVAMPHRSYADFNPYGSDYFGKPVGRWSNGRNFMDFITEGLGYGHIPAYLRSIGSDFTYGVNFASSGSTAANSSAVGRNSGGLFCLLVQVDQFRDFQDAVMSSSHGLEHKASVRQRFSDAIYFFETGYNDYHKAVVEDGDTFDLNATATTTIAAMKTAFQTMYALGAKTFIIMNVTPIGCSPVILSIMSDEDERDENSCSAKWMNIVQTHNERLTVLLDELREEYPTSEWVLFDAYSIFLDGYLNPSNYGCSQ
ncbi:hypothetical protein L7F22_010938 [Adiantum nelumboides]|nr:hypothetical protein [Adiantum nelumboides]